MAPMIILFFIMFVIGFIIVIAYLTVSRKAGIDPVVPQAGVDWDAIDDETVQTPLARGNKIEAIKAYRRLTGHGLKDAKDAIEYAALHPEERFEKSTKKKKATTDNQDAGIRDLILEGRMDEAVEVYQKFAGVDAYTAKDAVDEIARDLHQSAPASHTTFDDERIRRSSDN